MTQPDLVASIKACYMRIAVEAADGTTPAGALNSYGSRNLVTLTRTPEVNEGQDYSAPNACGEILYPVRDRPIIIRHNLEMEVEVIDPELASVLTSMPLLLSTPPAATTPTGNILTGSPIVSVISGGVTNAMVGATIAATGIPASSIIGSILSANSVSMVNSTTGAAANATATTVGVSLTITPVAQSIGAVGVALGTQASDNGVSLEVWSNAYSIGGGPAPFLPFIKTAFARTYWRMADDGFGNSRRTMKFSGYAIENPNWGNGPFNDWNAASPSAQTLTRSWGWHRVAAIPTAVGFHATPTQV